MTRNQKKNPLRDDRGIKHQGSTPKQFKQPKSVDAARRVIIANSPPRDSSKKKVHSSIHSTSVPNGKQARIQKPIQKQKQKENKNPKPHRSTYTCNVYHKVTVHVNSSLYNGGDKLSMLQLRLHMNDPELPVSDTLLNEMVMDVYVPRVGRGGRIIHQVQRAYVVVA